MRIVAGKHKGRNIPVRKNFPSRPTTDFAKENLFNVLANHFDFGQLQVLDLFSGTGNIGYEFASRGARVDMVERNFQSYKFILETLKKLGMHEVRVFKQDVFKVWQKLDKRYNIIFADPPFDMPELSTLPDIIFSKDLLSQGGWFILEHLGRYDFKGNLHFSEMRKYGEVHFSIFVNQLST